MKKTTVKERIAAYFDGDIEISAIEQARHDKLVKQVRAKTNDMLRYLAKKFKNL